MYFMTALLKAQGKSWGDGTALYWIMNNGEARRFTLGLTAYPKILNVMTFGAVILEFSLAFLLWVCAARPWVIAGGILLHAGIMLMINIPLFGEMMAASYLCFLTPGEFLGRARPGFRAEAGPRACDDPRPDRPGRPGDPGGPRRGDGPARNRGSRGNRWSLGLIGS